jgi:hypothetical protein
MAINTGINSLDAGAPGLRLKGEQQAGGPYNQGSDVKNALAVWGNMGPEDRADFEGFLDFFRSGIWQDQIQGMRLQERDTRTASAPDPQDMMNDFSMEIFGKPVHQLAPEELQELYDLAREQAASGGRIGLQGGRRRFLHGALGAQATPDVAPPTTGGGGGGGQEYRGGEAYMAPTVTYSTPTVSTTAASEDLNIVQHPVTGEVTIQKGPASWDEDPTSFYTRQPGLETVVSEEAKEELAGDIRELQRTVPPGSTAQDYVDFYREPEPTITIGGEGEGPIVTDTTQTVPVDTGLTADEDAAVVAALDYGATFPTEFQEVPYPEYGLGAFTPTVTAPQISFASRGGRIGYDRGGIAGIRQPFILGGIGKIFKKGAKAVKKIVKSPVGKLALLGGLGYLGTTGKFGFPKIFGEGTGGFWQKFNPINLFKKSEEAKKLSTALKTAIEAGEYEKAATIKKLITTGKTTGGLKAMDYAMMAGIPLAMKGAYEMPVQDDTEEMAKYTAELDKRADKFRDLYGRDIDITQQTLPYQFTAEGGRIGLADGRSIREAALAAMYGEDEEENTGIKQFFSDTWRAAKGGRVAAQEGGLMNLGGMEKDYRQEGGFVPIGGQEKADDVPARLSKNEFVFTADAVRAAGGGDIDRGSEVMENVMENLEAGGKVSEESQGLEGARDMFATSQQLEKRII